MNMNDRRSFVLNIKFYVVLCELLTLSGLIVRFDFLESSHSRCSKFDYVSDTSTCHHNSPWTVSRARTLSFVPATLLAMHWYLPSSTEWTLVINKFPPSTIRIRLLRRPRISSSSIETPSCDGGKKREMEKFVQEIVLSPMWWWIIDHFELAYIDTNCCVLCLPFSTWRSARDCLWVVHSAAGPFHLLPLGYLSVVRENHRESLWTEEEGRMRESSI